MYEIFLDDKSIILTNVRENIENIKYFPLKDVTFIFNRDLPLNQSEIIEACKNSSGIISDETIIANHPWTLDAQEELSRVKKERNEVLNNDVLGRTLS